MKQLTQALFQTYSNDNETIRIDILFNNTFNFFYFEMYQNDVLIQDTTKIVNNYENDHLKISSLLADYATYEDARNFTIEFKNEI